MDIRVSTTHPDTPLAKGLGRRANHQPAILTLETMTQNKMHTFHINLIKQFDILWQKTTKCV